MKCPICIEIELIMTERQGVEIDYCPKCRGVWLDRGELDKIADDLGWELLGQAQINPQGMVDFFARLKSDADAKGSGSPALEASLLSTHPTPRERIDRLRQKQSILVNREFKSFAPEFDALRAGLGRP